MDLRWVLSSVEESAGPMEKWKAAQKACEAVARSVGKQVVNWARRSALLMVAGMAVLLGAGRADHWVGKQVVEMASRLEQWLDKR